MDPAASAEACKAADSAANIALVRSCYNADPALDLQCSEDSPSPLAKCMVTPQPTAFLEVCPGCKLSALLHRQRAWQASRWSRR